MKKAVVLLLTLFFITAISALILKNLSDTETFLEEQNYIINNTQVLITIKNTQNEVSKLISKYKESIDEALENEILKESIPLKIKDLELDFLVNKYDKVDINEIKIKDSTVVEELFLEYNIFDYELFKEIYLKKFPIKENKLETSKQLDDIITTYIIKSYNNDILKIKDKLGFFKSEDLYELIINVKYNSSKAFAYYLLKKDGTVEYFDISFK